MSHVVSFVGWRPAPRYDGFPFVGVHVEESAATGGPWEQIDTIPLDPLDADPAVPVVRNLTTGEAELERGYYRLVFYDALGNTQVSGPITRTASERYAEAADLDEFLADFEELVAPADVAETDRVLARASRDVDRILGPYAVLGTGLKLDPTVLTSPQRDALTRATCAQAAHRLALGEDHFSEPEDLITGEIRVLTPAPRVSVRVFEELTGTGLLRWSGTLPPEPAEEPV